MAVLIVGASGATGKLLVDQLLNAGQQVRIIVRIKSDIPEHWERSENLQIIRLDDFTKISPDEMTDYLKDCGEVACCLGHHPSFKGIYGKPQTLIAGMVRLICETKLRTGQGKPVRFVLMNTTGNRNKNLDEHVSFAQTALTWLLRILLPPYLDHELAADYLRKKIGQNNSFIEWVILRPDSLTDQKKVTAYSLYASPVRSALFNPGETSRINAAHCMTNFILNDVEWSKWKGQMPVIYNERAD